MKAIIFEQYGSPDVLQYVDLPRPGPSPNEVLVKVHAASLNAADWHIMRGKPYIMRVTFGMKKPKINRIGCDLSGVVEAVGDQVTDFKVGDEVFGANQEEGVYYKFRSGIFAFKMDDGEVHRDTVEQEGMNDSLNFIASRGMVAGRLDHLVNEYASINSENWEFINKERKYRYELGEATVYLDELVYPIRFTPKGGGLFEGTMYISATNYAVIQLDFAYAKGKSNENIQLLGIGHSMKNKEGHVIFERGDDGYYVKYIYASQREVGSIDRSLSIMKKQKRFLWDKELNEIKMDINLKFDTEAFYELLVLEQSDVSQEEVNKIEEPKSIQFRKEYSYSADMWNDRTVIAPTTELRKYQRAD